jgi:hypothetical protein
LNGESTKNEKYPLPNCFFSGTTLKFVLIKLIIIHIIDKLIWGDFFALPKKGKRIMYSDTPRCGAFPACQGKRKFLAKAWGLLLSGFK